MIKPIAMFGSIAALLTVASADPIISVSPAIDVLAIIREFGFPIFVAVWFMWRLERRLDKYNEQIEKLCTLVTVMAKTIEDR